MRAIIFYKGKILCVQPKPYNDVPVALTKYWWLPGGALEEEEPIMTGLQREVYEELGVRARVGRLLYLNQFKYGNKDCLELFFHVLNSNDFLHLDLSRSSHGPAELSKVDFIDPLSEPVMPKFLGKTDLIANIKSVSAPELYSYQ